MGWPIGLPSLTRSRYHRCTSPGAGEVHLCWAPPTVCAQVEGEVPAILKSIRDGYSTYQAALVARAGEIPMLEALQGLKAVWVDPREPDAIFERVLGEGA